MYINNMLVVKNNTFLSKANGTQKKDIQGTRKTNFYKVEILKTLIPISSEIENKLKIKRPFYLEIL